MSTAAMPASTLGTRSILHRMREYVLPLAAISVIFVMLVPLPAAGLDFLLALSMAASIIVFLSAVQIRRAVELSVFPTLLLLLTLFRLSLNIASSRRILLHGSEGTAAAGKVIEAFGQFVVGGNYVVGFVLFLALIAIQFLVVSHGAVRTAEVTARFTLDALPGKQMAIDADMNAGLIDEAEARRRQAIAREAEFYGAMDGAARFNQRDSLATILITAINIIAGLLIGTLQQGIDLSEAVRTYTVLTVGDGLVTLIPSLLVSVAGGITLTRANSAGMLGAEIHQQLLAKPATLYLASFVSGVMCLIPGLPKIPFLLVSAGMWWTGRRVAASLPVASLVELEPGEKKKAEKAQGSDLAGLLRLEELTLEIGFQLIPLVDEKQGGQLLNRVRSLRRHLSAEMGFLVPPVHISDNLRLRPREYLFSLRGMEIGRWQTEGAQLLAVSGDPGRRPLAGREAREPAFGVPAVWIAPALEDQAIAAGYSVVDAVTVITTHLGELIRSHASELLGRAEAKRLMDALNESHPKLIEELVPKLLSLGEVGRVLEQLLRERVTGQLQVADSALGSVVSQLTQAITLATSANNGTMNANNVKSIGSQISGILGEVQSLANTNYQGQYIFAGGQTSTTPFSTSTATSPAITTYSGDEDVNFLLTPNGQKIQLNLPGDQIFAGAGANGVFSALNSLVADYSSGTVNIAQASSDTQALSTALNYVSQQRVTIDNSITQVSASASAVSNEQTQLTSAQTSLMQADVAKISTQLSLSETQQTALEDVISTLGSGSLFDKLH